MFEYCTSLKSINLHEGITSISADAFMYSGLTSIEFPNSLTKIGNYAFKGCEDLASVNFNKVETLGTGAFYDCPSLTQISLPETLKSMEHHTFTDCSNLTSVEILSDSATIRYSCFDRTAYFNDDKNWENGALYVGKYLIVLDYNFTGTTFVVKEGTTVIADFAFNINSLKISTIQLPETVTIIGESAFENLSTLNNINVPNSVIKIGVDAFYNTGIYNSNNSYWYNNGLYMNHFLVAVKDVSMQSFEIKEGTTRISDGALFGYSSKNVTEIILPDSLIYIGSENFKSTKITQITLPANLEFIGEYAFYMCSSLTTVDTSKCTKLNTIESCAFASCNISEVTIPVSVQIMGDLIFNHNKQITVNCQAVSKPIGWHNDWAKNNTGNITVNWAQY